jgi:phosphoglycolate phosphatase-like HAD superfamily hydrolase
MAKAPLYIFDIDGTLTDSIPTYLKVITQVLKDIGLTDIDTDYDNYLHHTDLYALAYNYKRNYGKNAPPHLKYEVDELLEQGLLNEAPVKEIPGARSTLLRLQKKQIPFAYGTGAFPKATTVKMEQTQMPFIKEVLATSLHSKSRVGFVKEAITKAKAYYKQDSFSKIIAVGDGVWDLKAAQELQLDFIGVGLKNKQAMLELGCKVWIENLTHFPIQP